MSSIPAWKLKNTHMSEVLDTYGDLGADAIRTLLAEKFRQREERQREERIAEKGTDRKQNTYVTDANKCPRAVHYSLTSVEPEPYDFPTLLTFAIGKAVEDVICGILGEDEGELIREHRVEIETPNGVTSGRSDAILLSMADRLFEVKSINSRSMKFMLSRKIEGNEDHRHQLNLYLHASQLGLMPRKFSEGWLIYAVKDSTKGEENVFPFRVQYDRAMAEEDLHKLDLIAAGVKLGGPPPKQPEGYEWKKYPCTYCNFRNTCYGDKS